MKPLQDERENLQGISKVFHETLSRHSFYIFPQRRDGIEGERGFSGLRIWSQQRFAGQSSLLDLLLLL